MSRKRNKYIQYELPFPIEWGLPTPLINQNEREHYQEQPQVAPGNPWPCGHEQAGQSTNDLDILVLIDTNQPKQLLGDKGEDVKQSEAE